MKGLNGPKLLQAVDDAMVRWKETPEVAEFIGRSVFYVFLLAEKKNCVSLCQPVTLFISVIHIQQKFKYARRDN